MTRQRLEPLVGLYVHPQFFRIDLTRIEGGYGYIMQDFANEYPQAHPQSDPLVSVVIPAHNEEYHIARAIKSVLREFESIAMDVEVIVVDDGSTDATYHEAINASKHSSSVKVISLEKNHGKGFALRTGFSHSRGSAVGFIDADLEYPVNALPIMAHLVLESGHSCAIASRMADDRPQIERVSSHIAHKITSLLLQLPIRDTQAGIKMFPGSFARTILTNCAQEGWLYDVEALLRVVEQPLEVIEVPVMQKSIRKRRANLWTMMACGPALFTLAVAHRQSLSRHSSKELRQVLRFGLTGFINTLVDVALFWGLIRMWPPHFSAWQAALESLTAWAGASLVGYILHSRYTFRRRLSHSGFYLVTGIGVAVQMTLTGWMTHMLGTEGGLIGKLAGIALASLITYAGYRFLAKHGEPLPSSSPTVRKANIPTVVGQ
ncbi:MAG: bifunctional glycosyltransferase family 2/GtrA family protein [Firmicutes bacterium]|nr:bifunctional glycosyltransferase family 2/GtrA family protein [Bacillota bacterium]